MKGIILMIKKIICILLMLLTAGTLCFGMTVCAEESDAGDIQEFKALGYTVKDPTLWEDVKGTVVIQPMSSGPVSYNPEVYASMLIYIPDNTEDPEDAGSAEAQMTSPGAGKSWSGAYF